MKAVVITKNKDLLWTDVPDPFYPMVKCWWRFTPPPLIVPI
jgi:hypothetical protein